MNVSYLDMMTLCVPVCLSRSSIEGRNTVFLFGDKRKVVTEAEFQEFLELADYMNFDFNPICARGEGRNKNLIPSFHVNHNIFVFSNNSNNPLFRPRNFPFKICYPHFKKRKVKNVNPLFCDCCGDIVKVVYPCKLIFHDGLIYDFKICPDCMDNGTLEIDLKRKRLVAQILRWSARAEENKKRR